MLAQGWYFEPSQGHNLSGSLCSVYHTGYNASTNLHSTSPSCLPSSWFFSSEGRYSWGYPWAKNIFWPLATWMSQVLQGNNHQSLYDSFGFSLGGRHWTCLERIGFWNVGLCALHCDLQCSGSMYLESLELKCIDGLSFFFFFNSVGSGCVPSCHLFNSYSGYPQSPSSFWFTTSEPIFCLMHTLYTCGSYFSDSSWETYSLLPSLQINIQVITLLKCLEGHLHQ